MKNTFFASLILVFSNIQASFFQNFSKNFLCSLLVNTTVQSIESKILMSKKIGLPLKLTSIIK